MRINLCEINEQNNDRIMITYDTENRQLFASDQPDEPLDTPQFDKIQDALDYCHASWAVDPVGVWDFCWTEDDSWDDIFRVREEYLDKWTNEPGECLVSKSEIRHLSKDWDVPLDELMEQVEEI